MELIVKKIIKKTKFIKDIKKDKNITTGAKAPFITLDIETRVINDTILPYLISYFDGTINYNFYLSDYVNEIDMLKTCILTLFKKKYHNHIIYVHNLSYFDGIFLMKCFSSIDNMTVKPLMGAQRR